MSAAAKTRRFDPAAVAAATADAYSAGSFEEGEWEAAAAMLADRGYSAAQAEWILRSKLTRWCRDAFSVDGWGRAEHLAQYLDRYGDSPEMPRN